MKNITGGQVSVERHGSGKSLWLFHSLLADRDSFAKVVGPLAKRFTVHLPELPGFGTSDAVDGLLAVADRMAEAVRASSDVPCDVLGNGYGGFVALQMAIRHPDLVSRLVLADCGACFSPEGRQAFLNMAAGASVGGLEKICDIAMRRLFAPAFQAANPELIAERRAAFLRVDKEVVIAACRALAKLDLRPDLARVTCPTLVLVGEEDEATPPEMSKELASSLPNARLQIIPGCAHVPQLQDPAAFLLAIQEFLR